MSFKLAFYKGPPTWWGRLIRWWDNGPYNHCEMVFSDGMWATAFMNRGVILRKRIGNSRDSEEWDFIELPAHLEPTARKWFEEHNGKSYDLWNILRFVFDFVSPSRDKWICTRACADALGMTDGWRVGPNGFAAEVRNAFVL